MSTLVNEAEPTTFYFFSAALERRFTTLEKVAGKPSNGTMVPFLRRLRSNLVMLHDHLATRQLILPNDGPTPIKVTHDDGTNQKRHQRRAGHQRDNAQQLRAALLEALAAYGTAWNLAYAQRETISFREIDDILCWSALDLHCLVAKIDTLHRGEAEWIDEVIERFRDDPIDQSFDDEQIAAAGNKLDPSALPGRLFRLLSIKADAPPDSIMQMLHAVVRSAKCCDHHGSMQHTDTANPVKPGFPPRITWADAEA